MLTSYVIPGELFASLSAGGGGGVAGRWLAAAEYSKHQLLLRGVLHSAAAAGHARLADIRTAYADLARIQASSSGAGAASVIRQPAVGAWAIEAIRALAEGAGEALPEQLVAITAAAAIRARVPFRGVVAAGAGEVIIPAVGRALIPGLAPGSGAEIVVTTGRTEILAGGSRIRVPPDPGQETADWQGIRNLAVSADGIDWPVRIDDVDPHRFVALPRLAARLTSVEAGLWQTQLADAWQLLVRHHRRVAEEVRTMIGVLTPLMAGPGGDVNATSRDTFGCIGLSSPREPRALALALAHEIQHAKLAALLDLVVLVHPGSTAVFYAQWRDDPRPPQALLHGSYAFLGVADFWRRQRHLEGGGRAAHAHAEFARWRDASAAAVSELDRCMDLTPLGRRFLAGMEGSLRGWQRRRVPAAAAELARDAADRHRARWRQANPDQVGGGSNSASSR